MAAGLFKYIYFPKYDTYLTPYHKNNDKVTIYSRLNYRLPKTLGRRPPPPSAFDRSAIA